VARPMKWRRVCCLPDTKRYGPLDRVESEQLDPIRMTVDEYETIRLIDLEGFTQAECARQMGVARTTVQGIYAKARYKLAASLVETRVLVIDGGEYQLCDGTSDGCFDERGCYRRGQGSGLGRGPGKGRGLRRGRGAGQGRVAGQSRGAGQGLGPEHRDERDQESGKQRE
jgi:predicted DNA-binding protein (UPF0251 family)